ncbi:MAG: hypothetical protein VKM97_00975 [Cyanobacteriota bacterium]|nr:hypothetical protein [Cyanobacteriota bacterium]
MRGGKKINATCVKNRKRTMKSKMVKQRGFMDKMKAGWNSFKSGYKGEEQPAQQPAEGVAMSAMKSKSKSKSRKAASKSRSKSASRKSGSKSGSRASSKRVLGKGACTSRKISECTKDSRCLIRKRPSGGKTCVLGKGWKQVHNEAERLAMIGAY